MFLEQKTVAILEFMNESLATRIKESRKLRKLSQKTLAEKIGVTPAAISQYESKSDSSTEPSIKNLAKIADVLDISFEWLATGRGIQAIEEFIVDITKMYESDNRLVFLSDKQKRILEIVDNLPEDLQEKYLDIGEAVTKYKVSDEDKKKSKEVLRRHSKKTSHPHWDKAIGKSGKSQDKSKKSS